MRTSLVVTGIFTAALGLLFYVLEIPFVFSWSFPFILGGFVFVVAGAVIKDSSGYVEPPSGYAFCVFCNIPILTGTKKCERCNGVQPS